MVRSGERPTYILFLTDGQPTIGVKKTERILKNINGANETRSRIFVFGVGHDVNADLLDRISKENRGVSIYVDEQEDLERALSSYYGKISSPILSNIKIAYENIQIRDTYPRELPDLFKGSQLVLIGKYAGRGPATVKLTGSIGKREKTFVLKNQELLETHSHDFLPRLWSTRRVGYLLEEIRLHGEEPELVDEIKHLGVKFGIVTPYTSFLVREKEKAISDGVTIHEDFLSDMPIQGREYQRLLRRAPGIQGDDQDRVGNVKGSRDRDFKAMVKGISNVEPLTGKLLSDLDPDVVEEIEIIASGAGAAFARNQSGFDKIRISRAVQKVKDKEQPFQSASPKIKYKDDKTFYLKDGHWVDSEYEDGSPVKEIMFNSEEYYRLIRAMPGIVKYLSVARKLIICFEGVNYKITDSEKRE
jgi:Ca-activated chloride channel family protein